MTSSNGNFFRVTGPLYGEFTGTGEYPTQRPVTRSFDVFFDLRLNKRLNKQPWCWWFETPLWSLWRQCNEKAVLGSLRVRWSHDDFLTRGRFSHYWPCVRGIHGSSRRFPSQNANNLELWCFHVSLKKAVEQSVGFPVIWEAMTPDSLHCNENNLTGG